MSTTTSSDQELREQLTRLDIVTRLKGLDWPSEAISLLDATCDALERGDTPPAAWNAAALLVGSYHGFDDAFAVAVTELIDSAHLLMLGEAALEYRHIREFDKAVADTAATIEAWKALPATGGPGWPQ